MIDPVIFSFKLFNLQVTMTWYGVIVIMGVFVGAWIAEREVRRRGENGDAVIDATLFAVLAGVVGARLWYVGNAIIAGNRTYIENPLSIIMPPYSGLHFFGGLLFGAVALIIYFRANQYDFWLFFDAIAPATLVGQAIGRLGNFVNIELYGQPTTLPWGFNVPADRRLPDYADLSKFPEGTLFHPTFFYEMLLNVLAFLFILWYSRRNEEEIKPGTVFSLWLIFAGFNRVFIEFFRPDQPKIGDTFITTSMLIAFLMGVVGLVLFLARTGKLDLAFAQNLPDAYAIKKVEKKSASSRTRKLNAAPETSALAETEDSPDEEQPVVKRRTSTRAKATTAAKPAAKKPAIRKKKAE